MNKLIFNSIAEFKEIKNTSLPKGSWFTITQQMINDFAASTGDEQWIHIDEAKAKQFSPFKKTVAHGFMSVAMLSNKLEEVVAIKSLKMSLNYGVNNLRFPSPVPVDSELRLVSAVKSIEDYKDTGIKVTFDCAMEIKGHEKPACVAEFIALMFE